MGHGLTDLLQFGLLDPGEELIDVPSERARQQLSQRRERLERGEIKGANLDTKGDKEPGPRKHHTTLHKLLAHLKREPRHLSKST